MGRMSEWRIDRLEGKDERVKLASGEALTWAHIDKLTDGSIGTFSLPCPYCGAHRGYHSRCFKIKRPSLGSVSWVCHYCNEGGELTRDGVDPEREAEARHALETREEAKRAHNTARALAIWNGAASVTGTPVIDYLRARAIRDLPPNVDEVLRYHPKCPWGREVKPCMLALFRDVITDEPLSVHRTWFASNGKAFERMALGPFEGRAAIKLWPADGERLTVGEGIETVLSAALYLEHKGPLRPAWSLTTARNLAPFPVMRSIRQLIILTDNDETGVGQGAAKACTRRWRYRKREAVPILPPAGYKDFNDFIRGKKS